jgi:putative phosphoesterase
MKIAILSDIHDNIWKLDALLADLQADALVFCGDFCAPFTLAQIAEGFAGPVHAVFGNNDGDQFLLAKVASRFPHVTLHGVYAELEFDARKIAVTHYPEVGIALSRGAAYDLVCHGHSHERIVERHGKTLRVNPGEVMGRFGLSTYAEYDTSLHQVKLVEVSDR